MIRLQTFGFCVIEYYAEKFAKILPTHCQKFYVRTMFHHTKPDLNFRSHENIRYYLRILQNRHYCMILTEYFVHIYIKTG
jgi:hypothetical protein